MKKKSSLILHKRNHFNKNMFTTLSPLNILSHSHNLSGHPGRDETYATITENCYFPNIKTLIAIHTQGCLNRQTSKSMPNLLMAPQQPSLEVSSCFNHRI